MPAIFRPMIKTGGFPAAAGLADRPLDQAIGKSQCIQQQDPGHEHQNDGNPYPKKPGADHRNTNNVVAGNISPTHNTVGYGERSLVRNAIPIRCNPVISKIPP